jgi:hypothetical protein
MVRAYTDDELMGLAINTRGFTHFPEDRWLMIVRSKADKPDEFDDKCYQYEGHGKFLEVMTCTTNPGTYGLLNFFNWNKKGAFVLASNLWQYDVWKKGSHRGKMDALVQNKKIFGFRDNDKDMKSEELGVMVSGWYGINFHTVSYSKVKNYILKLIGKWSTGCVVGNNVEKYYSILGRFKRQKTISICVITEK